MRRWVMMLALAGCGAGAEGVPVGDDAGTSEAADLAAAADLAGAAADLWMPAGDLSTPPDLAPDPAASCAGGFAAVKPAGAPVPVAACSTISASGNYVLTQDLAATTFANCLVISADQVH